MWINADQFIIQRENVFTCSNVCVCVCVCVCCPNLVVDWCARSGCLFVNSFLCTFLCTLCWCGVHACRLRLTMFCLDAFIFFFSLLLPPNTQSHTLITHTRHIHTRYTRITQVVVSVSLPVNSPMLLLMMLQLSLNPSNPLSANLFYASQVICPEKKHV